MLNLTYNDTLSAYGDYSSPIRPYLVRAETHPLLRKRLTKSFMRAFIDLLSRTNIANPARPIWVRVDTTAKRLGISEKTVSRTIALMKESGWLRTNEHHDGRNWQGKFAGREFILSAALREMVGLPVVPASHVPSTGAGTTTVGSPEAGASLSLDNPTTPRAAALRDSLDDTERAIGFERGPEESVDKSTVEQTEMSDGSASFPQEQPEVSDDQTEMSDGYIGVNNVFLKKEASLKSGAFIIESQGEKTIRIPADLAEMHTVFGVSGKGICGLMRLAKEKCMRLQDVWKAKKDQLAKAGATGGRAVLYLRRLLTSGEDFAYIARNMIPTPCDQNKPTPPTAADAQSCPHGAEQPGSAGVSNGNSILDFFSLTELGKTCAFKKFRHVSNGMIVRFYENTADVSRGNELQIYAGWDMMRGLYLGVSRGNLIEIRE